MITISVRLNQFYKIVGKLKQQKQVLYAVRQENGQVFFRIFFWKRLSVVALMQRNNIAYQILPNGYAFWQQLVKKNAGLLAGFMFGIFLMPVMSIFVFRVEIIGATNKTKPQIEAFVQQNKILPISIKNTLASMQLADRLLENCSSLAFASMMFRGSTLFISVKERVLPNEMNTLAYLPLRSTSAGIVEEIEVFQGTAAVKKGDFVQAGEALVMPYVFLGSGEKKDVIANGAVVLRCFAVQAIEHVTIGERMVRTGKKITERKIAFMGKIVYHATEVNTFQTFDTETAEQKLVFGNLLPIYYFSTTYYETKRELFSEPFEPIRQQTEQALKQKCKQLLATETEITREFFTEEVFATFVKAAYVIEYTERIQS